MGSEMNRRKKSNGNKKWNNGMAEIRYIYTTIFKKKTLRLLGIFKGKTVRCSVKKCSLQQLFVALLLVELPWTIMCLWLYTEQRVAQYYVYRKEEALYT